MFNLHPNSRINQLLNQQWDGYLPVRTERLIPHIRLVSDDTLEDHIGYTLQMEDNKLVIRMHSDVSFHDYQFHMAKAIVWLYRGYKEAKGLRDPFHQESDAMRYQALSILIPREVFLNNLQTTFRWPTWKNWRFWNPTPDAASLAKMFHVSPRMLSSYLSGGHI